MSEYRIFTRTWWKRNPDWPDGREPCIGRSTTIGYADTLADARRMCKEYNTTTGQATAENRFLSRKAEFESC